MPYIISREQAITEINSTIKPGECLACSILKLTDNYVLYKGNLTTVLLSKYPRTWGQTMVILNSHKVSVSELSNNEWTELTENVRKASIAIESTLKPLRCYISSLGATENLPNTCPHLHFNVLPIYNSIDKPTDIFTWQNGLYAAEQLEWENLHHQLKQVW